MAGTTAKAKHIRIAPRKMRLVADLVRGKKVAEARTILQYTVKNAAPVVGKLLASAVANVDSLAAEKRQRVDTDEMVITQIYVDEAPTRKKFNPAPRGRAMRIRKRGCHVTLSISDAAK